MGVAAVMLKPLLLLGRVGVLERTWRVLLLLLRLLLLQMLLIVVVMLVRVLLVLVLVGMQLLEEGNTRRR